MARTTCRVAFLLVLAAVIGAFSCSAALAQPFPGHPRQPITRGTSTNWSGYAAETNLTSPQANAVTDVLGIWQVPFVTGTSNGWSSAWVGIDGYSSGTVEQLGTEQDTSRRSTSYYAWYEMYPGASYLIRNFAVKPGNIITAEVKFAGSNQYVLSMKNISSGRSFQTTQTLAAQRTSAEWIMEAPWSGNVLPLANFGTAKFSACNATVNGVAGPISAWANDPMTMVGGSGTRLYNKAVPSLLSASGDSFNVTWYHN